MGEFFKWDSGQKWDTDDDIRTAGGISAGSTSTDPGVGEIIATGDVRGGSGLVVGDTSIDPADDSIAIASKTTNPSYSTAGHTLFSRNNSLLAVDQNNHLHNLTGGSYAGFMSPGWFGEEIGNWSCYPSLHGAIDHSHNHYHLTSSAVSYGGKGPPAPMYIGEFNGAASFSGTISTGTPLEKCNWFSFGTWVKLDSVATNHGLICSGSTTVSWWVLYYGGYFEFGYYDTGATARSITMNYSAANTWVFVGGYLGHNGASGFDMGLKVDDAWLTVNAATYPTWTLYPQTPVGLFTLGFSQRATLYLDGQMATAWFGAYSGDLVNAYYAATRGCFNI